MISCMEEFSSLCLSYDLLIYVSSTSSWYLCPSPPAPSRYYTVPVCWSGWLSSIYSPSSQELVLASCPLTSHFIHVFIHSCLHSSISSSVLETLVKQYLSFSRYPFYVYYYQLSYQTFTCQKDDLLCNFLYMYVHSPLPVLMWLWEPWAS